MIRQAGQRVVREQEREIEAPRVEANTRQRRAMARRVRAEAVQDTSVQRKHIPMQAVMHAHRSVRKAMDLLDLEPRPIERPAHRAATLRAKVKG